jgi:hypothetical protein
METEKQNLAYQAEIVKTTNSAGWPLILKLMDDIAREEVEKAVDQDNPEGLAGARAYRAFVKQFHRRVDACRATDVSSEPFASVLFEYGSK